jgi:hypothetical protein
MTDSTFPTSPPVSVVLIGESYEDDEKIYRYLCEVGHEWSAPARHGKRGSWCRLCAHQTRSLSLDIARKHARQNGGKCLATEYINSIVKMPWRCRQGHLWEQSLSQIRAGEWCKACRKMERESLLKSREDNGPELEADAPPLQPGRRSTSTTNYRRRGRSTAPVTGK